MTDYQFYLAELAPQGVSSFLNKYLQCPSLLRLKGIGYFCGMDRATIHDFISDTTIYENEDGLPEIGFKTRTVAERALAAAESLNNACSDREDVYMMGLLADITRRAIDLRYISYDDLYKQSEKELLDFLYSQSDSELATMLTTFASVAQDDIPPGPLPRIKSRKLNPLVNGERLIKA